MFRFGDESVCGFFFLLNDKNGQTSVLTIAAGSSSVD